MPTFNHMFTIAFTLENGSPEGETTGAELRAALLKRIHGLPDDELVEACGYPDDTYEVDQRPFLVRMSVTRVTEYEAQIRAVSLEAAHRIASAMLPEDCQETSQDTIHMGVEVDPV